MVSRQRSGRRYLWFNSVLIVILLGRVKKGIRSLSQTNSKPAKIQTRKFSAVNPDPGTKCDRILSFKNFQSCVLELNSGTMVKNPYDKSKY
jgi:hypothetical protein